MAYNDKKVFRALQHEINGVPERCHGYLENLEYLLLNIINRERSHEITRTNVTKKVSREINDVAMFLYRNQSGNENYGDEQ